jgi:hypothetical protein
LIFVQGERHRSNFIFLYADIQFSLFLFFPIPASSQTVLKALKPRSPMTAPLQATLPSRLSHSRCNHFKLLWQLLLAFNSLLQSCVCTYIKASTSIKIFALYPLHLPHYSLLIQLEHSLGLSL